MFQASMKSSRRPTAIASSPREPPSSSSEEAEQQKDMKTDSASSPSCHKCVTALRDLIDGLQKGNATDSNSKHQKSIFKSRNKEEESPPLTLLKAIAGISGSNQMPLSQDDVSIEEIQDGVKVSFLVEATEPNLLRRWSSWATEESTDDDPYEESSAGSSLLPHSIATSIANEAPGEEMVVPSEKGGDPLVVELTCRKCATTGPEARARAFLMGPYPLSVVICHDRIDAESTELEELLTHELVHLHDVQTLRLDLQQCENLAYSEIRAAREAECRDTWKQFKPYCVERYATSATRNLFPVAKGRACVKKVFEKAFEDHRPFPPT